MRRSISVVLGFAVLALALGGCNNGSSGGNDGVIQFNASGYSVDEDGTPVTVITVTRSGGSGAVSVEVTFTDGTATSPSDYDATPQVIAWAAGDTTDKTFSVPIVNDHNDEPDEFLTMTLGVTTGGAVTGAQNTATLTIIDDDVAGSAEFDSTNYFYGEDGSVGLAITVNRVGGVDGAVSALVTSVDGTANSDPNSLVEPVDYSPISFTVSWADGDATPQVVTVSIVDDLLPEIDEDFTVNLSNLTNGLLLGATPSALVTIVDNDTTLQINNPTAVTNGHFGQSLATVGQRIAVGAPGNNAGAGNVYLMDMGLSSGPGVHDTFDGGAFAQGYGWSLAFSGNTLAVGGTGRAWSLGGDIFLSSFFDRFSQTSTDVGFGSAVFLLGGKLFVGAPQTMIGGSLLPSGRVYSYDEVTGSPSTPIDGAADQEFGTAFTSFQGDIAVGAPGNDGLVAEYDVAVGNLLLAIPNPFPQSPSPRFGQALASTASTLLVGSPDAMTFAPAEGRVYILDGGTPQTILPPGPATLNGRFGSQIFVTSDGHTCIQQAGFNAGSGRVWVFDSSWGLTQVIDNPIPTANANFGAAMCELDGMLVVSAPNLPGVLATGTIFVFRLN